MTLQVLEVCSKAPFKHDAARARAWALTHQAVGRYFTLDPTHPGQVRARLSARPPADHAEEQGLDARARTFHAAATPIDQLSDGVKAYTSVVAMLASSDYRLILADEPDAFFHPPLARRLGTVMAQLAAERGATVFAATHSVHYLMGCVASGAKVNIVRLTYQGGVPTARLLPHDRLTTLMRDPLLRAAKALDALFAAAAVVCEADADRALYEEVNTRLWRPTGRRSRMRCS